MLGHASAAMTLDVYADLFDSDLTSVAESVGKMWARQAQTFDTRTRSTSHYARGSSEPPVRIELTTARLQGD
jgi:hypothetical protein